jgi:hypothetical protein
MLDFAELVSELCLNCTTLPILVRLHYLKNGLLTKKMQPEVRRSGRTGRKQEKSGS